MQSKAATDLSNLSRDLASGPLDKSSRKIRIDLRDFTDVHISAANINNSLVFPGPRHPKPEELELFTTFLKRAEENLNDEFMIHYEGYSFRGHREKNATDGVWYRMRRQPQVPPTIETLPTALPLWLSNLLLSPTLKGGGLLYFTGSPAQGKTTTASATLVSRLATFGGYAQTIEDPPEMPLNGWHGKGFCSQTWVGLNKADTWGEAIKGALRSMPAGTPCMLYIGEVRDQECALTMLRAASNGFLVIATGFANDILTGLQSLAKLAGDTESTRQSLANALRLICYMRISDGMIRPQCLVSTGNQSSIAAKIRSGDFPQIQNDINYQAQQTKLGKMITFDGDT